jgi:2-polyprenyl-3-methyl-5-hydroxy-6-metoxy-1,4-benzoquinol methylase
MRGLVGTHSPHIFGPINLDSIVTEFDFNEGGSGFELPKEALDLTKDYLTQSSEPSHYDKPIYYDALYGSEGSDVSFYLAQAIHTGGRVLDLACGTGRLTIPLAEVGLEVTGLDLSKQMLELAKEKAKFKQLKISFELADIRVFQLNEQFDYIFCGFNSAQHLYEEAEFRSFLRAVKCHLKPNGLFIFDIFNPNVSMLSRPAHEKNLVSTFADPKDGQEISLWEYPSYQSSKQLSRFHFQYFKNDRLLFEESLTLRNYFPLEIDVLLRNSGFNILKKYGNFNNAPFEDSSMKQIFICELAT